MEAEYIAANDAAKEAVWMRKFMDQLGVVPAVKLPIPLYCDNTATISLVKEPRLHKRAKHILRKYHLIREIKNRGDIEVLKVSSEDNLADPFTKALARERLVCPQDLLSCNKKHRFKMNISILVCSILVYNLELV